MLKESATESQNAGSKVAGLFFQLIVTVLLLYVGGWSLLWKEKQQVTDSFTLADNGFAIKFNDNYYGLRFKARFFDSPVVSWGLLCAALGITPIIFIPLSGHHGREA
jgi:hypothetical protein